MDENQISGDQGEAAVNELAFNTYLKYWCYPNPKDERGSKKEICDLLILFKSTIIIISIKNYAFKGNYERYFRSTLDKAVDQIQGAERKLFANQFEVYIKHPDLPEVKFEPSLYTQIFRIVVNLNNSPLFYSPGRVSKNGYVHIFNWDSFYRTILELDTIPDFINYLKVRQDLFKERESLLLMGSEDDWDEYTCKEYSKYMDAIDVSKKTVLILPGNELDLLADYYFNEKRFNKHLYSEEYNYIDYELDGKWVEYLNRKEVQRKKQEDKTSYFIDEFIKREVLYYNDPLRLEIATELLSLTRFERRALSVAFFDFIKKHKDNKSNFFIARRYGKIADITIGFFIHGNSILHEKALNLMQIATEGYLYWDKYKTKKMIMIGFPTDLSRIKFNFAKDTEPFDKEYEEDLIYNLGVLEWFKKIEPLEFNFKEYPD